MADRYQDKHFPADDGYDRRGDQHLPEKAESDPLAELARLIGQTDPFAGMGRANQQVQPHAAEYDQYQHPDEAEDIAPSASPPPWMQRAAAPPEPPAEDYPSAVHPLRRYATPVPLPEPDYHEAPAYADDQHATDPSRYDDALYGQLDHGQAPQHDPAYPDDPYAYDDGYGEGEEQQPARKRGAGMMTVVAVLALAVVGTGAAYAYRNYVGSPRSGEPPIIKADNSPTKIVPTPSDGTGKVADRMVTGDGKEKIVPREEAPVDPFKSGPRVVFPPLNQNTNPPTAASVAPTALPAAGTANGTLPNNEPRKIRTLAVRGDAPDAAATPVTSAPPAAAAKQAPAAARAPALAPPPGAPAAPSRNPPSAANASANGPLSLAPAPGSPQAVSAAEQRTRVAATNPTQAAPATSGGNYLVQVSSQKNEADAQASYRALQSKFPSVLGSRAPLIKRADLGDKGVYYRAMVGPFGSSDEAAQFCGNLKTAGGQCVVQKN